MCIQSQNVMQTVDILKDIQLYNLQTHDTHVCIYVFKWYSWRSLNSTKNIVNW